MCSDKVMVLPPIRGSLPEVIRSWCAHHHHHHHHPPKVFAGRLNARGTRARASHGAPAARGRRAGGARPWSGGDAARAPPSCHEPPYRRSARAWRRRWQQGPRGVPPHPRPRQELEARLAPSLSSSAQHTTSSTSPLPPGDNVRSYAGGTCRRPGAQRPRLRRRARSARQ